MRSAGAEILVIGYGNDLRGDDAAGRRLAEAVQAAGLPGVRALSVPQLAPELAEEVARAALVVFADASLEVRRARLEPLPPGGRLDSHGWDPALVVQMARQLFRGHPDAWLLHLPARRFGLGEPLSPLAARGVGQGLACLAALARTGEESGSPRRP
jgi:hydrogenase maturation protease